MAKILLVISIVVTLLTAGLAYMAKTKVGLLQDTLASTRNEVSSLSASLKKTQGDLKKTTEDLTASNKTVEDQKGQISTLQASLDTEKKRAEEALATIQTRDAEIAKLNERLVGGETKDGVVQQSAEALRVAELEQQLQRAMSEAAELKAVQEQLNTRVKDTENRLQRSEAEVRRYQTGIARQGLTGRILAVNQGWNFVVIDVGDRQGATVNSPLVVMRDGQPIARLRITSVEPSTSVADVIPGSVGRGTMVQPGDRVVFSGRQPQPGPSAQAPNPAGAPAPQPQ